MKFLENSTFDAVSRSIGISAIDCVIDFKLESYSCKMVQSDKKQWKTYDNPNNTSLNDRQPLSPPDDFSCLNASPIGHAARLRHLSERSCSGSDIDNDNDDLCFVDSVSRRTLFDLIGVLNSAYPDYDFSEVKSHSFSLVPTFDDVSYTLDVKLNPCIRNYSQRKEELWNAVEDEISPNSSDCRFYSFKSTYNDDPFSEDGCIWSIVFILYNKTLKRLLLLSCRCLSKTNNDDMFPFEDEPARIEAQ